MLEISRFCGGSRNGGAEPQLAQYEDQAQAVKRVVPALTGRPVFDTSSLNPSHNFESVVSFSDKPNLEFNSRSRCSRIGGKSTRNLGGCMEWHERLERKRLEKGISGAELGRLSGIKYDNVMKYLRGKVERPRGDTLSRLAGALGTTEKFLLYGDIEQANGATTVNYDRASAAEFIKTSSQAYDQKVYNEAFDLALELQKTFTKDALVGREDFQKALLLIYEAKLKNRT